MRTKIYNFFTYNINSGDYIQLRKVVLTNVFILASLVVLSIFGTLNVTVFWEPYVALIDYFAALVALYSFVFLRTERSYELASKLSSLNLFIFFLTFAYVNQNRDYGFVWIMFLPIFIIPLNGHKAGLKMAVTFYAILFFMAYINIGVWQEGMWNIHSFLRLVVASTVLTYVIYMNEVSIHRSNQILVETKELEKQHMQMLEELSLKDSLTDILNRRAMMQELSKELSRRDRYGYQFSLVMMDVDNFKQINDHYGHDVGDTVLVEITKKIKSKLRDSDLFSRWGGEEFLILMRESDALVARNKVEELRRYVEELQLQPQGLRVSASFGVSECNDNCKIKDAIKQADIALYEAKKAGRNRVV